MFAAAATTLGNVGSFLNGMTSIATYWPSNQRKAQDWEPEGITLVALGALLAYLPLGTKLHWEKHHFTFHIPQEASSQALDRRLSGDSRADLANLVSGINTALTLFPPKKVEYPAKPKNAEKLGKSLNPNDFDHITQLWYTCIEGLICHQKTYGYEHDSNISLDVWPSQEEFGAAAILSWNDSNRKKYTEERDQKASEALHTSIVLIKSALINGHPIVPDEKLSALQIKVKNAYLESDQFKEWCDKINQMKLEVPACPPKDYKGKSIVTSFLASCETRVANFETYKKEVTSMQPIS